jgi:hypothetical protein
MKKIDFPLILDVLFYSAAGWFLSLGLLRYFRLPTGIAIATATLIAIATGGIAFLIIYSKHRKNVLSKREREQRDALLLHFALEKSERVRAALLAAFLADRKEAHCEGDILNVNGVPTVPLFTMQPVTADAIALLLREYASDPFTLICNDLTPEADQLLKTFGRKAVRGNEVYALIEKTNTMPAPLICGEIPRKTLRGKLRISFSKKNARPFFVSGLLLLIMSLFAFFPIYYLITGSVLLLSSVCIRAFGYA